MTTYAGLDTYPADATLPDPNQPAVAPTVSDPEKVVLDRTTFLLKRLAAHAESQSPLGYRCTDGTKIVFEPVFGVVSFDTMPRYMQIATATDITVANLDGGGSLIGNNTYYIYLSWIAGAPKFVISLSPPDPYRLYKDGSTSHALVGVVQTDATAKFMKGVGGRHEFLYLEPPQVQSSKATTTGDTINLSTRLPPIADTAILQVNGVSTVAVIAALRPFVAIGPEGFPMWRELVLSTGLVDARVQDTVKIPLLPGKKASILTNSVTSFIDVNLAGFTF